MSQPGRVRFLLSKNFSKDHRVDYQESVHQVPVAASVVALKDLESEKDAAGVEECIT